MTGRKSHCVTSHTESWARFNTISIFKKHPFLCFAPLVNQSGQQKSLMTPRHTGHSFKPDMVTYSSLAGQCLIERCIMTSVPSLSCLWVNLYCRGNDGPKGWGERCRNFSQRESPNLYNKHKIVLSASVPILSSLFKNDALFSPHNSPI